jgi:hypothetical protein
MPQKQKNGWGGRRAGAGRPVGSRNRPTFVLSGIPDTTDPLQWLQAAMGHPGLPLRQRVKAAKALMQFCHAVMG